jgi:UDP-N-acetylmuramate: L-alanyl-gamma-D-glutamyl-meso-diaminopimelate ligase
MGARAHTAATIDALLAGLKSDLRPGDHALLMSNGGFGGLHERLLTALQAG